MMDPSFPKHQMPTLNNIKVPSRGLIEENNENDLRKHQGDEVDSNDLIRTKMKRIKRFKTQKEKGSREDFINEANRIKGRTRIV